MSNHYTEQDTERARWAERSSAGMETQQLGRPAASQALRSPRTGLFLVGLGALMLVGQLFNATLNLGDGMVLFTIGAVFFFFGFWRQIYGLIIPASILTGLSLGVTLEPLAGDTAVLWGLALGFLSIFGLGRTMFQRQSIWPVIPAVILFAVGMLEALSSLPIFLGAGMVWLPMLLIAAGVYLGSLRRCS
ncbi:MAG: hypothetical protein EI684_00635 [Candidatus Viridilinea halotolerans]|uniref:DUF308 domain-containing protein n=1 Tax=Candidatus Viridilinea halotolerans TaxID=2491704 RepID=A0A426UBI7_9CHLR|nr:MAG: hypothetical protein EI684_00635 [Candidatus Viridilinea halotolerans]